MISKTKRVGKWLTGAHNAVVDALFPAVLILLAILYGMFVMNVVFEKLNEQNQNQEMIDGGDN